jgi:hypothetical protein
MSKFVQPILPLWNFAYRWGLDDRNRLDNLLLVQFRTWPVEIANNGRHAGFVAHGGSEVDRLLWVILGEAVGIL